MGPVTDGHASVPPAAVAPDAEQMRAVPAPVQTHAFTHHRLGALLKQWQNHMDHRRILLALIRKSFMEAYFRKAIKSKSARDVRFAWGRRSRRNI